MSDAKEAAHNFVSDYFYRTRKSYSLGEHSELCAAVAQLLTETRTKALSEKEAENARLRDALKDAAEELREIVSWTVTEKSKLRAQELDQIAVTQGKIRAALKAEGGEK